MTAPSCRELAALAAEHAEMRHQSGKARIADALAALHRASQQQPRRSNGRDHLVRRCGACGGWLYHDRPCGTCAALTGEAAA